VRRRSTALFSIIFDRTIQPRLPSPANFINTWCSTCGTSTGGPVRIRKRFIRNRFSWRCRVCRWRPQSRQSSGCASGRCGGLGCKLPQVTVLMFAGRVAAGALLGERPACSVLRCCGRRVCGYRRLASGRWQAAAGTLQVAGQPGHRSNWLAWRRYYRLRQLLCGIQCAELVVQPQIEVRSGCHRGACGTINPVASVQPACCGDAGGEQVTHPVARHPPVGCARCG
jgi:hypothetical protein